MTVSKTFTKTESKSPLLVGAFIDEEVRIDPEIDGEINALVSEKLLDFKTGKVNKLYTFGKIPNQIINIIGLGNKADYGYEALEECLAGVDYRLGKELIVDFDSFLGELEPGEVARRFVKAVADNNYVYDELKSEKTDNELDLKFDTEHEIEQAIEEAFNLSTAVANTRDLVNKPYNRLSAAELAEYAANLAESLADERVSWKILGKNEIEALGMNAFLGVNKGSDAEPKLIHLQYKGSDGEAIGLVGKGIMYDTGGYSLKTNMINMKSDMAGAAAALGAFEAAVKNNLKVNLQVVICATDNRVDGKALLPDDVLTAMNKKTIEIISTDGEGRLTLADAACFAQKEGCKTVVDIATLTGACVVALGNHVTGLFGNCDEEVEKIMAASRKANEELWRLPINKSIREQVRSSRVADLKNSTGRAMGASGAAAFIEEFIESNTKWLHLDIAGTAFRTEPKHRYGGTGVPVNTLYHYLKEKESE